MNDATREYEFESIGESTIRETWRASAPADLEGDDLAHFLEDEMREGRAEFVDESNEDENGRELVEGSIEPAPPKTEPAYTISGYSGDHLAKPFTVTVYTHNGPEAALTLAHTAYADAEEEGELQIVAIFAGEAELIDFDRPETWTA